MESPKIIVAGQKYTWSTYFKDVYEHRSLITTLARRDIRIKYAQSLLGIFWVIIQPVIGVLIFTLVIGRWMNIPDINYPYPLFAFAGIITWNFFSYMVTAGGVSLSESRDLIHRIPFPRIILPLSKIFVGLFDMCISLIVLVAATLFSGHGLWPGIFMLPFFILVLIGIGFSLSLWLSALTIRFTDFYHLIPYAVNFGIWVTPVFYPIDIVPSEYLFLMFLNPVAFAAEGIRWSLFHTQINFVHFLGCFIIIGVLFVSGLSYFRSVEKKIPDAL